MTVRPEELRNTMVRAAPVTRLTVKQQAVYGAIRRTYEALEEPVREALLVRRLGMTRVAIRRHMAALARKGLVDPGSPTLPRQ